MRRSLRDVKSRLNAFVQNHRAGRAHRRRLWNAGSESDRTADAGGRGDSACARGTEPPYDLSALLQSGFWSRVRAIDSGNGRAPMFQPIGGMDQIPMAFQRVLADKITLGAAVESLKSGSPDDDSTELGPLVSVPRVWDVYEAIGWANDSDYDLAATLDL